jgi:hypothetical protein
MVGNCKHFNRAARLTKVDSEWKSANRSAPDTRRDNDLVTMMCVADPQHRGPECRVIPHAKPGGLRLVVGRQPALRAQGLLSGETSISLQACLNPALYFFG